MLDSDTKAAVRDAVKRVLDGRERVPGDLPFPPSVREYLFAAMWPADDAETLRKREFTEVGRDLARAVRQVYIAGYFAGRAGDEQIAGQVRRALGVPADWAKTTPHGYVGLAVCIVCDQAPDHPVHEGEAESRG